MDTTIQGVGSFSPCTHNRRLLRKNLLDAAYGVGFRV